MRKANLEDVKSIQRIVNNFAKSELMLPRALNEIYENIRDFWIYEEGDEIVGCCALHPVWDNLAEIKSLAVTKKYQGKNIGKKLVETCLKEAVRIKATKVFALTFVPEFFKKIGFVEGHKEEMPHKIWSECIKCPHFPDCDEILVVREL